MATSELDIAQALYTTLHSASGVTSLVTGVFDVNGLPEKQPYPYIVLGETTEGRHGDTFGRRGYDSVVMIHIWSVYTGKKESLIIHNAIHTVLDNQDIHLSANTLLSCQYDNGNTMMDNSTTIDIVHRIDRYRITTEEGL